MWHFLDTEGTLYKVRDKDRTPSASFSRTENTLNGNVEYVSTIRGEITPRVHVHISSIEMIHCDPRFKNTRETDPNNPVAIISVRLVVHYVRDELNDKSGERAD